MIWLDLVIVGVLLLGLGIMVAIQGVQKLLEPAAKAEAKA